MADAGEQKVLSATEVETPADFLTKLGHALRGKENVDVAVADILAKHLLTASPAVDALSKAKNAILKLAAERANSPRSEAANG